MSDDPLIVNATIQILRAGTVVLGVPLPLNANISTPRTQDAATVQGVVQYRCMVAFSYLPLIITSDFVNLLTWNGVAFNRTYSVLRAMGSGGLGLEVAVLLLGDKSAQSF